MNQKSILQAVLLLYVFKEKEMIIEIKNFGDILISRPAGKEAFQLASAYVFKDITTDEPIILDFKDVNVLTPSWADEFITNLKSKFSNPINFLHTDNPSVKATLSVII